MLFGATMYHLLTNQPLLKLEPVILNPESLIAPRQIKSTAKPKV
jgi:hypothetical protein